MNIGVIGCGAYSLALGLKLKENSNNITIWSENEEKIKIIKEKNMLNTALPHVILPEEFNYTTDIQNAAIGMDIIFVVVSIPYIESTMVKLKEFITDDTVVCLASKGIDADSNKFVHEIVDSVVKIKNLAIISGPGFAIDLAKNNPVGLSVAGRNANCIELVKKSFTSSTLNLVATTDFIGLEICGSIKNVIAIGAGILNGMGYSESTVSYFLTDAINETKNLIKILGGDEKTILTYGGIGDIILTSLSSKSRNYTLGTLIGRNENKKVIDNYLVENTVEGYFTLKSLCKITINKNIEIELINILFDIIINKDNPQILIEYLANK